MKCLKCNKKEYCSQFCKEHFISYFKRKFKKHLSMNNLLKKNETLNLFGENKSVVKFLLIDLGRKVSVKFLKSGRRIETFSLDTRSVKELSNFMNNKTKKYSISFLETFTSNEIEEFAKLNKLKISKPKFNKFETNLNNLMKGSLNRRPNIYYCTYNMMKELT